jgi:hypothetical protein
MNDMTSRRALLGMLMLTFVAPLGGCASQDKGAAAAERSSLAAEALADPTAPATTTKPSPRVSGPPLRVLFIGNSYTFYNGGVDAVVAAMARAGGRTIDTASVAVGDKSLEWHWQNGDARAAIARGGWDYVVLQELSTRPVANPELMTEFARKFDADIKAAGAKTVLFGTWGRYNEPETQRDINRAYEKLAAELGARLARVGPAFERVLEDRPSIRLHADDRSHPSGAGTYLAAAVFYATLTSDSPEGLPSTLTTASGKAITLDPADAKALQRAAGVVSASPSRAKSPRTDD